jgi:uncharacterized protein (TIGR03437 family)
MSPRIPFVITLLCGLSLLPPAQARNVFVMPPADGTLRPVAPFQGDPFAPGPGGILAAQDTFLAFATPAGNKFYFIGRSGIDTVVVTDASFAVIARRNLGTGATAAALSPDGRRLVVLAGTVQVLDTITDQVITQLDGGASPNDVSISRDSQRAFVTSQISGRLTSFDLNTFAILGQLQNLGPVNGVSVGPNGLVYVSATNILYEIDPRDLTFRQGAGIPLSAQPGKPAFAADTFGNIRVVMANLNPGFGGSSLITVDLGTRTFTPLAAGGIVLDRIIPVSNTRVFATSQTQQLYDITLPTGLTPATFTGLASTAGVRAAVASNEFPNPRYLYIAQATSITRVDLATGGASGSFNLANAPGGLSYAGAAATGLPSNVYLFNNGQFVGPSAQSLPLIMRAVDGSGRPLAGVPSQCSTTAAGAFIVSQPAATDAEGYSQTVVIAPANFGAFSVTCNVGTVQILSATFNLTVGTGTTGPTGAIAVRSGNGQVIRESAISEAMRVLVRDAAGNPVPNALVSWSITSGTGGTLTESQNLTNFLGEASNVYIAPVLGPNLLTPYVQTTITASTFTGSVNLFITVIPNQFGQNPATLPTIQVLQPTNTDTITGQAGTTLTGAIQVRVTASAGPGVGQPIPNVGISISTGLDPLLGPTATCRETTGLTDSNGIATCDLVLGGRVGSTSMSIQVGGSTAASLNLVVTPGLPGRLIATQGDNQSGAPGVTLPLALVARVEDSFGNLLPNAPVTWIVESGSATLVNTISRSDNLARVSTLIRLGSTPGPVRIRVTAQGGTTSATLVFTATVVITATQMRQVSGDGQSAVVNQAFSEPLVAQVLDANGQGVPGVQVTFSIRSGSATIATPVATSDSAGTVRTSVTAGGTPGAVTIAAEFAGNVVTWTLTVRPLGPEVLPSGFTNAATGLAGISPGAIVTIRGRNIAATIRGYVLPANDFGPRPGSLAGVSVIFGSTPAPIFWVANVNDVESVTVQAPFELPDSGVVPVTINVSGTSATVNVPVQAYSPGILENIDAQGRRYGVVTRMDGSFVTPDNPIGRGENARVYVIGLGRTTGAAQTNAYGAGQRVNATLVAGINDAGVRVISGELAQGLIGVYIVTIEVPQDTATGSTRNLVVAVDAGGGNLIFSNGSTIAIR